MNLRNCWVNPVYPQKRFHKAIVKGAPDFWSGELFGFIVNCIKYPRKIEMFFTKTGKKTTEKRNGITRKLCHFRNLLNNITNPAKQQFFD